MWWGLSLLSLITPLNYTKLKLSDIREVALSAWTSGEEELVLVTLKRVGKYPLPEIQINQNLQQL